jgi:hypothetical protein
MLVLETLSLRNAKFNLMELDLVHRNIPSMKSLHLTHASILNGNITHDILAAVPMTTLGMHIGHVADLNTPSFTNTWSRNNPPLPRLLVIITNGRRTIVTKRRSSTRRQSFRFTKRLDFNATPSH